MQTFEQGAGDPLVLIPGIQGPWQYLRPAVDALSTAFRVITFSLSGEPASGCAFEPSRGWANYVDQVVQVLDEHHVDRAVICGVSFGGLIAVRFAAAHPDRVRALVLASPPPPRWRLPLRHRVYIRLPRLLGALFAAETPLRLRAELAAALPDPAARWRFVRSQLAALRVARLSFARMAERGRLMSSADSTAAAAGIIAPALVTTGERTLDKIVPVDGSLEYVRLIQGARHVTIDRTGHLGSITRPEVFTAAVRNFIESDRHAAA